MINEAIDTAYEIIINEGAKVLRKKLEDLIEKVKAEYLPLIEDFKKNLTGELEEIAMGETVDILDIDTLKALCIKHKVPGSNEVVATKVMEGDDVFMYLTYAKNRELIQEPKIVVIIKANKLDESVSKLFEDSELIILK